MHLKFSTVKYFMPNALSVANCDILLYSFCHARIEPWKIYRTLKMRFYFIAMRNNEYILYEESLKNKMISKRKNGTQKNKSKYARMDIIFYEWSFVLSWRYMVHITIFCVWFSRLLNECIDLMDMYGKKEILHEFRPKSSQHT